MIGSILGGIIGNIAGGDERRGARDAMSEALGAYREIKVPTVEEQRVILQQLKSMGELTPELEQEILAGPSAYEKIKSDDQLRQAQLSALSSLKQVGQMGLTPEDRAALYDIRSQVAQQDKARQDAIIQNLAARGMAGGGAELAQRLASAQAAAETQAKMGSDLASQAFAKRLQAVAQSGSLGGQIRSQDFDEASQRARAEDVINQFNIQNRLGVQQRNVGTKMGVQQRNLAEKQRIADENAAIANQQEIRNKALYQQQFQNAMMRAQGLSGQLGRQADFMQQQAQQRGQAWAQAGQGVDVAIGQGIRAAKAAGTGGASEAGGMAGGSYSDFGGMA